MLDLTQLELPEEKIKIKYNDKDIILKITAEIPRWIYKKYGKEYDDKDIDKIYDNAENYLIDILSIKNDNKLVKKIVANISTLQHTKILNYINDFIQTVMNNNEIEKKKKD